MDDKIVSKITDLTNKTSSNLIKWKRINKTTFDFKKEVSLKEYGSDYNHSINTITTIQKSSGNFIFGYNTFYKFTIIDDKEKEILVEVEADANENKEYYNLLETLFESVIKHYNQRGINIFDKIVE